MISFDKLKYICANTSDSRLNKFVDPLNSAMREFSILSNQQQNMFIAQVAHESGELRYLREFASGKAYEGRKDLGNTMAGDGARYKGRGLIQITGRNNYRECGEALGLDLIHDPTLLEDVAPACLSAAWFWKSHGLNELAEEGNFKKITRRINGGYNGMEDREKYLARAEKYDADNP